MSTNSLAKPATPVTKSKIKPWRRENAASQNLDLPLIPEDYIDPATQRMIVFSFVIFLQAYKLWDLLANSWGSDGDHSTVIFLLKHTFIEGLFLAVLPIFRIPWLTFTYKVSAVLFVLSAFFNLALATISLSSITAIFVGIWKTLFNKEVSISGAKVRQRDVYDPSSHLSGKYIVQILPESTALLNPTHQSFCLESSTSDIWIPVRFNATNPMFLQLNQYDFNTKEMTTTNFTKKQLKKFKMSSPPEKIVDPRISYYQIPVSSPGLYRIGQVVDASGLNIRLYRSDVIVSRCPSAYIFSGREKGSSDLCIGDIDLPKISVNGVPPLTVKYSKVVQGEESKFSVQGVSSDYAFQHPLTVSKSSMLWNGVDSLLWASTQSLEIEMDTALEKTGDWVYYIDEVEDALGNVVNYKALYDSRENPELMFSKSLGYGFEVHPRPHINFRDCNSQNALKPKRNGSVKLQALIKADRESGPFEVEFEYTPLEDGSESGESYTFTKNFTSLSEQFAVSDAGIYRILNLKGKYCRGTVLEPSACVVYVPPEPAINVSFEDVEDKCAGPVGVNAGISLTGTPPFLVYYRVLKNNVIIQNEYKQIGQTRDRILFRPKEAGDFTYEFYKISDSVYKDIDVHGQEGNKKHQTIQSLAGASFKNRNLKYKACSGDVLELPVSLNGVPPFKLNYEIKHGSSLLGSYTEDGITDSTFVIKTQPLKKGGTYTVSLVSVENNKKCVTTLKEPDVIIDVSRMRPTAGFLPINDKFQIKTLEGTTVGIPTKFSGEGPWNVLIKHISPNGTESQFTQRMSKLNGELIRVSEEGSYILESVKGAYCPGQITQEKRFDIKWLERPTLSVNQNGLVPLGNDRFQRNAICQNDDDVLELSLSGSPPFNIYYDVSGPKSSANQQFAVGTKFASLVLENSKPGLYKYKFSGISDDIYGQKESSKFGFAPIIVEQIVNPRPSALFADRGKTYKTCVNNDGKSNDGIPLVFTGKAPFSVSYSIYHESTGKSELHTVENIPDKRHALSSIYKGLGLGTHKVTLISVSDSNGCKRLLPKDDTVFIHVNDVPYATPLSPRTDYCVGERIGFSLSGFAPFDITYEFNGKRQTVSTASPFSRLASSPGNLTLISLSDTSSCVVGLNHNPRIVHPIPSVKISEGTTVIQDIHEGDQAEIVFSFEGTPPFSFTYTRSEMVGNPPRLKVVETNTVTQVFTKQYSVFTSLQGTYEAILIEDAFCSVSSESTWDNSIVR